MPHLSGFLLLLFVFEGLNLLLGPTVIVGRASCQEEGSRGGRGKGKFSVAFFLFKIL